jgi:CRP-like cAMP-binding protein
MFQTQRSLFMSSDRSSTRSLNAIPIFRRLTPEALAEVEQACAWRRLQPEQSIVDFKDPSRDVYFLTAGRARSVIYAASGTVVAFGDLPTGSMFGEIAAIDGKPRAVGVEAVTACTVAAMPHTVFLSLIASQPEFTLALMQQIAANIRMLTARVFEFSTLTVNNRIHAELLRLIENSGSDSTIVTIEDNVATVSPSPTHAALAARISTQREAVTREINRLTRLKLIKRSGVSLIVADIGRLRQMVQDASGEQ